MEFESIQVCGGKIVSKYQIYQECKQNKTKQNSKMDLSQRNDHKLLHTRINDKIDHVTIKLSRIIMNDDGRIHRLFWENLSFDLYIFFKQKKIHLFFNQKKKKNSVDYNLKI